MHINILFATFLVYGILIELFAVNFQVTTSFGVPLEMLTVIHKFQKFPAFHEPEKAHYHFHQDTPQHGPYRNSIWYEQSGDQIAVGAKFSTPIQTSPGHPTSLLHDGYWVIPGARVAGVWHSTSTPTEHKG
jgi:hypothetical protein